MMEPMLPHMQAIVDAGFTADELKRIAVEIQFATIEAVEDGHDVRVDDTRMDIEWTAAKEEALAKFAAYVKEHADPKHLRD